MSLATAPPPGHAAGSDWQSLRVPACPRTGRNHKDPSNIPATRTAGPRVRADAGPGTHGAASPDVSSGLGGEGVYRTESGLDAWIPEANTTRVGASGAGPGRMTTSPPGVMRQARPHDGLPPGSVRHPDGPTPRPPLPGRNAGPPGKPPAPALRPPPPGNGPRRQQPGAHPADTLARRAVPAHKVFHPVRRSTGTAASCGSGTSVERWPQPVLRWAVLLQQRRAGEMSEVVTP